MKKKILISLPEQKTLVLLGDALKEAGFAVLSAVDGAKALQMALAEIPDLIVLNIAVTIIDGERLTAILRANPKTEKIPILFLAPDRTDIIALLSYQDSFLPVPLDVKNAVARVASLFGKEDKVREVSSVTKEIEGSLTQIPLVDLLQVLCMHKKEGTVTVERGGDKGVIYLRDGNIIDATVRSLKGEKPLFRLLSWQDGRFSFSPHNVGRETLISGSPDSLLIEGMRQIDETERYKDRFPRVDSLLTLKVERAHLPQGLRPITQQILMLLEFYSRVGDIVDNCPFPDYECFLTLQSLIEKGILEETRREIPAGRDVKKGLAQPEKILKLKDKYSIAGRSRLGRECLRVVVFSPSLEGIRGMSACLRGLSGMIPLDHVLSGTGDSRTPFGVFARVPLSDSVELHFLSVPLEANFSPLWKAFSSRALGGVLLWDESLSERDRDIRAVRTAMSPGPAGGLVYATLRDPRGGWTLADEETRVRQALNLENNDAVLALDIGHMEGATDLINEMIDRALS